MKAIDQYFSVVLFIVLYKVILTFESVDEILKSDHLNECYRGVLFCGTVYYAVQAGSMKTTEQYFPGGVTWVNFCWVCAAGLSEPRPHYSLFCS